MPAPFRPGDVGPNTIESGDRLDGRYLMLETVGHGGSGSVWRAHDELLGRDVAVKRLHIGRLDDPERALAVRDRARREGRVAARLHHPRLASIFDMTTLDGEVCLVMEFVRAPSLADLLEREGPLGPSRVAHVGGQIAEGLAAMHRRGILHRDIKPANIMIGADDAVTVTDFGIAVIDSDPVTADHLVAGTPHYMAPEVARGASATAASDVFSLGATLYAALEGTPPVGDGGNALEVLARVAAGAVQPTLPYGGLGDLVAALLDPDPDRRPTAEQVADGLGADGSLTFDPAPTAGGSLPLPAVSPDAVTPVRTAPVTAGSSPVPIEADDPSAIEASRGTAARPSRRRLALALGVVGAAGALGVLAAVPLSTSRAPAAGASPTSTVPPRAVPPSAPAPDPVAPVAAATASRTASSTPVEPAAERSAAAPTAAAAAPRTTARTNARPPSRAAANPPGRARAAEPPARGRQGSPPGQSKPKNR
jgi:serine/threonine protein kinase